MKIQQGQKALNASVAAKHCHTGIVDILSGTDVSAMTVRKNTCRGNGQHERPQLDSCGSSGRLRRKRQVAALVLESGPVRKFLHAHE